MPDFNKFKIAVSAQWQLMLKQNLYRTAASGDELWSHYLASFPPGTNPIFRERTEHDCSCCKHFIRNLGNVVAISDSGELISLWDLKVEDETYQAVVDSLSAKVKSFSIENVFLHSETNIGTDHNFENTEGGVLTWDHFQVTIPLRPNQGKNYILPKAELATALGEKRSTYDVFLRGLLELTSDSLSTVLEIIDQNSLYRGNEYRGIVAKFYELKQSYNLAALHSREALVWSMLEQVSPAVARIRNTAIGTLLIDLSEGTDLERAVHKFETQIMAPSNYKRPTALVSQRMVDEARAAIEALGLSPALHRRHARLTDISVNDILFADRSARKVMRDSAFEGIANKAAARPKIEDAQMLSIEKFITEVLPNISSLEVFVENKHEPNFVSIIAPQDLSAPPLFKWNNPFSWAYNGNLTDSLRERVKRAGGNISGDLCCRLSWNNFDDLDLHMIEPRAHGSRIYYRYPISHYTKGQLDVDMNAGHGHTREPVENIFYPSRSFMIEGNYTLAVNQFQQRESSNPGFEVEIDILGEVTSFSYLKIVKDTVEVAVINYTHKDGFKIIKSLPSTTAPKTLWNLKTQDYHRVTSLMLSPNHWEGSGSNSGNRHYFFMLDGAATEGAPRPFFNEFLKSELEEHRKVLEIVSSKMKVEEASAPDQLSGLGFSDTKRAEVLLRVKNETRTQTLKVLI